MNGFQFVDAPISEEVLKTWDFKSLCLSIQARRSANPRFQLSTDLAQIEREVDYQNAMRMLSIAGADTYIVVEGVGPPGNFPSPRSRNSANVVGGVKQLAAGAGVLKDWLGDGAVPVDKALADSWAQICTRCPLNEKDNWLAWFTEPAQDFIRRQLSIRKDLDLTTPDDANLGACSACACPLKLKVHVPLNHILDHLNEQTQKKLDSGCWITAEKNARR